MISVGDELVIVDSTDATNQNKLDALTEAFEAVVDNFNAGASKAQTLNDLKACVDKALRLLNNWLPQVDPLVEEEKARVEAEAKMPPPTPPTSKLGPVTVPPGPFPVEPPSPTNVPLATEPAKPNF
jgi:hypothetical protein